MTRTTDTDPKPGKPLGEKVERRNVSRETSKSIPRGDYGIVIGEDGRYRTTRDPYTGKTQP